MTDVDDRRLACDGNAELTAQALGGSFHHSSLGFFEQHRWALFHSAHKRRCMAALTYQMVSRGFTKAAVPVVDKEEEEEVS